MLTTTSRVGWHALKEDGRGGGDFRAQGGAADFLRHITCRRERFRRGNGSSDAAARCPPHRDAAAVPRQDKAAFIHAHGAAARARDARVDGAVVWAGTDSAARGRGHG